MNQHTKNPPPKYHYKFHHRMGATGYRSACWHSGITLQFAATPAEMNCKRCAQRLHEEKKWGEFSHDGTKENARQNR